TSSGINDKLAWDYGQNRAPALRSYEIAAIAPDLFDITYYSIEPNYDVNYLSRIRANAVRLGLGAMILRPDLGYHGSEIPSFSIQEQLEHIRSTGLWRSEAFYLVRDKAHLLTGWVNNLVYGDYSFDVNKFGKCAKPDDNLSIKVPGSCTGQGGRTGYSV